MSLSDVWPLANLRVRLGEHLQLEVPDESALAELAGAAERIYTGPDPFSGQWADGTPQERAERVVLYNWKRRAEWTSSSWCLLFAVRYEGIVVGCQDLAADDFAVTREVRTASWLSLRHHGRGIGTAMRIAVLAFAFEHVNALSATSGAYIDNPASLRVSAKVGYREDGVNVVARRGERVVERRFRMDRADWPIRGSEVVVEGLDGCRDWFGAGVTS